MRPQGDGGLPRAAAGLRAERRVQLRLPQEHPALLSAILQAGHQHRQPLRRRLRHEVGGILPGDASAVPARVRRQDRAIPDQQEPKRLPQLAAGTLAKNALGVAELIRFHSYVFIPCTVLLACLLFHGT